MSERRRSRQSGTKSYAIVTHVEVYVAEVVAPCMIMIAVHSHGRRCRMRLAVRKIVEVEQLNNEYVAVKFLTWKEE